MISVVYQIRVNSVPYFLFRSLPCVQTNAILCTVPSVFSAKTPVRAKPDGLTPVALRAKRPLIAPSRPSPSRLVRLSSVLAQESGAWEGARMCARRQRPILSCKSCVFAVSIFPEHYCPGQSCAITKKAPRAGRLGALSMFCRRPQYSMEAWYSWMDSTGPSPSARRAAMPLTPISAAARVVM